MKRRLQLHLLAVIVFLNPLLFTGAWANNPTFLWTGLSVIDDTDWNDPTNWLNMDDGTVPTALQDNGDMMIDGAFTVYVYASATTGSIQLSGGATLVISAGATLTTQEGGLDGSHGIRLDEASPNTLYPTYIDGSNSGPSALLVYGNIDINVAPVANYRAPASGLFINSSTSVTVYSGAKITIIVAGTNGIEVTGSLSNFGTIEITDPTENGILLDSYGSITNESTGTIFVSGGTECMSFRSNSLMVNDGHVELTGSTTGTIVKAGSPWGFTNNGTFQGDGLVERTKFFTHSSGSTIIPGSSPGCLTFDNRSSDVDLSGVTLQIDVTGSVACSEFDQITFTGSGDVNINGANLSLTFGNGYSPSGTLDIILDTGGGTISGDFSSVVNDPVSYSVAYSVTSTDVFLSVSGGPLPVELTTFTARPTRKGAELYWATATELNNDYFSIERSTDGKHFSEIGRVAGFGTTQEEHHYTFTDLTPAKGLNYYRLNQRDFDGGQEYSKVVSVLFEDGRYWSLAPTLAQERIVIQWLEALDAGATVEIFNLSGQKVYTQEAPPQALSAELPVDQLAPGMYWVVVQGGGPSEARKFVKQ
ncbi:MAG: T9SS type A sorting domain-containing protein [Lewinellaceae bacterium]|nr:T9SS type A sorting domain-containing protein [Lewinellaceae bacterium]